MKTENVDASTMLAALAAQSRGRAPRAKRMPPAALGRAAASDPATDWTQGKADKALAMGHQIAYDAEQRCWAMRGDERRGPFGSVTELLRALQDTSAMPIVRPGAAGSAQSVPQEEAA